MTDPQTPEQGRAAWLASATEAQWQRTVDDLLHAFGWRAIHIRDGRRQDVAGFPDVLAVRDARLLAAELKTQRGRLTPDQRTWLEALRAAGVETYVWRPADVEDVERALRRHW
jgi:hypothetical protein